MQDQSPLKQSMMASFLQAEEKALLLTQKHYDLDNEKLSLPKTIIQEENGQTVEKKTCFEKKYIFDEMLNCYFDPETNEYFQEAL